MAIKSCDRGHSLFPWSREASPPPSHDIWSTSTYLVQKNRKVFKTMPIMQEKKVSLPRHLNGSIHSGIVTGAKHNLKVLQEVLVSGIISASGLLYTRCCRCTMTAVK